MIIFLDFQDFMIYLENYFWSMWNSPNLIFQLFEGSNESKKRF